MRGEATLTEVFELPITSWQPACGVELQQRATAALEGGAVLFFPQLAFPLDERERELLSPATGGSAKNVSLDVARGRLRSGVEGPSALALRAMMERFVAASTSLVNAVLPEYTGALRVGRTSFRPIEIAGRATSWRKDDTRLHVDSFPSTPMRGLRILRLFTNVNPDGKSRVWRVGEPFEAMARRFVPGIRPPVPGSSGLLALLHATKGRRSAYDHFMLQLHDRMKADAAYQADVSQATRGFPPGTTWMVYTDQVSHAAMSGQHALEQTFYLPVDAMSDPARSPLRILERLLARELV